MSLKDSEFRADRLNVRNLKLNGIDISNFQIETLGDGKYIDSLRGDIQVKITPSMLDASGNYVIQQIPGLGRFARAELSTTVRPVYYLAPNGLDTNLGTKTSPWQTLTNVPNGSIVVLLNGTYSGYILNGSYQSMPKAFFTSNYKYNLTIVGESKTGVIVNRVDSPNNDDEIWMYLSGCSVSNMTINVYDRGNTYFSRALTLCCYNTSFHNITFNITGTWAYVYWDGTGLNFNSCTMNGGTYVASSVGNNTTGSITYTVTDIPANIPAVGLNNNNVTINGTRAFPTTDTSNTTFKFSGGAVDFKSNTLTFNTDKRNFDTITLDIWLEQ